MKYALVNNTRITAQPATVQNIDYPRSGTCPGCGKPVVAKTGDKNAHHWAHKAKHRCAYSTYSKGKGEWHYFWQELFSSDEQEVHDPRWPNNIADIVIYDKRLPDGYLVVELQQSKIKLESVLARNTAYKNIMWVSNGPLQSSLSDILYNGVLVIEHNKTDNNTHIFKYFNDTHTIEKSDFREYCIQLFLEHSLDFNKTFQQFLISKLKQCPSFHNLPDTYTTSSYNRTFVAYSLRKLFTSQTENDFELFSDLDTVMKTPHGASSEQIWRESNRLTSFPIKFSSRLSKSDQRAYQILYKRDMLELVKKENEEKRWRDFLIHLQSNVLTSHYEHGNDAIGASIRHRNTELVERIIGLYRLTPNLALKLKYAHNHKGSLFFWFDEPERIPYPDYYSYLSDLKFLQSRDDDVLNFYTVGSYDSNISSIIKFCRVPDCYFLDMYKGIKQ